jgi:hypothetical protein
MSDKKPANRPVNLTGQDPKYLLLGIDPEKNTQQVATLIAYGPAPDVPGTTLVFATRAAFTYEEFRLMIDFEMFKACMDGTQHMDIMDIDRVPASIPKDSELGAIVREFQMRMAEASFPGLARTFH